MLTCALTGETYALTDRRWKSEAGGLLDLVFDQPFDPEEVKTRAANLWRYREALPLDPGGPVVACGETITPLVELDIAGRKVPVKLDYLFPTGSYKDRGAAILMSHARHLGIKRVVQDSSGNAGCAIAAYAARAGIACDIYVPADTSPAKLLQIERYGATLHRVPGSRADTAKAAQAAAAHHYYASHVWQPLFFHGTKTFAYELAEQLDWQLPDTVVLPAGNGTSLLGAYRGFREMKSWGITQHVPRLVGIQAARCAPLLRAWQSGDPIRVHPAQPTLAEGIAIDRPMRGEQMLEAVRQTGGAFLAVEEALIIEMLNLLNHQGQYIEPTSAAVLAGLRRYLDELAAPDEQVLSVLTGHGLKSTGKLMKLAKGGE